MKIGQSNGIENLLATFCYFAKSCTTGLKLVKIVMNRVLIPIDRITEAVSSKPKVIYLKKIMIKFVKSSPFEIDKRKYLLKIIGGIVIPPLDAPTE